ncbi:heavy metal translocating P-type ATPase [Janibacter hoylei]|uniref:heavy metal translocating P-type ATPase n=1 Tax=Janibacter hoylei TaxID=364298 RepID=UPI0021A28410|nr:heavy metal translocating P-type ATPase [Janibacter hoylei]MCT1618256.1 cadmium-translocating P-type ATPase [Janibacter hoylei]MCT2293695.1 cadmium-translocating P-type ATPase [Janibacter hoylei]
MSTTSPTTDPATTTTSGQSVDLAITGMTCASCSARIERNLGKIDGVEAVVNLATEKARVSYPDDVTVDDLVASVESAGYGASVITPESRLAPPTHTPIKRADLQRRAVVAGALALVVVVLAMGPWDFAANPWLQWLLATPVVTWAAWPFHRAAYLNARHLASTMDTLVSLGVSAAYLWSTVTLLTGAGPHGHYYFETAAVITTFLLLGRWLEARSTDEGRSALTELMDLGSKGVAVQRIDSRTRATTEVNIPLDDLQVGDHFIVRPGEKVATDGTVIDGTSSIDTSLVTGESLPVDVRSGDHVDAGTVNTSGRLVVEATAVGSDTTYSAIVRLVEQAQTGKADIQRLADRVSAYFVPAVLGLALLTFVGWWIGSGSATTALGVAVTVLIIACPCALGLATPMALLVGTSRGAQRGILVKGAQVLEDTRRIDTIVLDKTGTITTGVAQVTDLAAAPGLHPAAVLTAAAAVESGSEHPIARAIVRRAQDKGIKVPAIRDFEALPGSGAVATIKDTRVTVGRADLFEEVPAELATLERPGTTVFVGWDGVARGALTVADEVRDTSGDAIRALRAEGLQVWLLSGDNEHNATKIAAQVGIDPEHVVADVRPQDKHDEIARLQDSGRVVAMVGDGINDAAAIVRADLGMAMGTGTDVAMESADIVLVHADLESVPRAIALSRATLDVIKQNLAWAFGYNIAAIPLAMAGLLNPMIAGAAMALSSVLVVLNSLRLRRAVED